jgi:hypothetical protein
MIAFSANFFQPLFSKMIDTMPLTVPFKYYHNAYGKCKFINKD